MCHRVISDEVILLVGPVVVGVAGGLVKGSFRYETTFWASLARVFLLVGGWMLVCAVMAVAQGSSVGGGDADAVGPAFEVATVRPSNIENTRRFGIWMDPSGRLEAHAVSVKTLFWQAYGNELGKSNVTTDRGAPKWVESELFDVNAKVDEAYMVGWEKLSDRQRIDVVRPMLRRLLADRFKVRFRVEMRKTPVYALVQAKGGAHVKEVPAPVAMEGDPNEAMAKWFAENPGKAVPGGMMCGGQKCMGNAVRMRDAITQIEISSGADRMVIDETGLKGYYDLSFTLYLPQDSDESPMRAVEDDLGVRFEPQSVAMKTYVIEAAEKPSVDGE